jgi:hypothetical protein
VPAAQKVRENRLRRIADRRGYRLVKSRSRDPHALDYGLYALIDLRTGDTVNPAMINQIYSFCSWGLDEVERCAEINCHHRAPARPAKGKVGMKKAIDLGYVLEALGRAIDGMTDAEVALENEKDNIDEDLDDAKYDEVTAAIDDMISSVSNLQAMIESLKSGFEERFK